MEAQLTIFSASTDYNNAEYRDTVRHYKTRSAVNTPV